VTPIFIGVDSGKAKKRKQVSNVDNSDTDWFSTPHYGVDEGTLRTQATSAGSHSLTKSAETSPPPASSSTLPASQTSASHAEVTGHAGPSTSVAASVVSSSSQKSPLTMGQNRGRATYAYRTARSPEQSTPIHFASVPESPETDNSAVPPTPTPSTSKQIAGHSSVLPSRGSLEPGFTSEGPPPAKYKSVRRKKREETKRCAASASTVLPATATDASPDLVRPVVPSTVEDGDVCDPPRNDDGQTVLDLDVPSTPANVKPEPSTGREQLGSGEDRIETDQDDPALNMRAGLIVNGVSFSS
jgi:hypothetical protein